MLLLPTLGFSEGIHGNNITVVSGWTFGDTDIDTVEQDNNFSTEFRINYFVSDEFYLTSGVGFNTASYVDDGTDSGSLIAKLKGNIWNFGIGVGYETLINDNSAIFVEGGFIIGSSSFDAALFGGSKVSFDASSRQAAAPFGARSKFDKFLSSIYGSLSSSVIDYDLAGVDDVNSSGISLNGLVAYNFFEDFSLGLFASTDFDIHFIGVKTIVNF